MEINKISIYTHPLHTKIYKGTKSNIFAYIFLTAIMQFLQENITKIFIVLFVLFVLYVWHRYFKQNISRFSKMCFRKLYICILNVKIIYLYFKRFNVSHLNVSISAIILYCMLHSELFRGYFAVYTYRSTSFNSFSYIYT